MTMLKMTRPLVVFDIESTGVNPRRDRIIDLAAIKVMPDGTEIEKSWRLNPTVPIPPETTEIHGITDADVKDAPTFAAMADEIFAFFEGCDLSGFNADRFDIPCLEEEFSRAGKAFAPSTRKHVDVQRIYHRFEPRDLTSAVRFYLGRDHEGAHGALADTKATLDVLKAQLGKYDFAAANAGQPVDSVDAMDEFLVPHDPLNADRQGMLRWKDGELYVNFGKKKGETLKSLCFNEPNYLRWILKNAFDTEVKAIVRDLLENGRLPPPPKV